MKITKTTLVFIVIVMLVTINMANIVYANYKYIEEIQKDNNVQQVFYVNSIHSKAYVVKKKDGSIWIYYSGGRHRPEDKLPITKICLFQGGREK